jgi:riboflavin kinase / FMN adenylyltransferase
MIHTLDWHQSPPEETRDGALTIGNFDGVHLGHRALVAEVRQKAHLLRGPAVVLSFEPHPLKLLRPELFQPVLTTAADRAELLLERGADHVLFLRTTPELLRLTAEEFFHEVIVKGLKARAVVEGINFGFGRGREGNVDMLRKFSREVGIELIVVPPVHLADRPVSSSRVREALVRGAVKEAGRLLDRPYRLRAMVVTGRRRGRTIGFPTANLEQTQTLVPGDGVYAVRVQLTHHSPLTTHHSPTESGWWAGAANIGPNPTFGEQVRKVEVHLLGFDGELVGQELAVDFLDRLRDTRPFPTVEQLVAQLRLDVAQAGAVAGAQY